MNPRITSIDALRGLVMFTMIFVNDLASAGAIVPNWMMHYELRHPDANGMTFVDLVLPAFLFIVGMSIPFALGSRLDKGERTWKTILHVLQRTASLLFIGVLMVNGEPDAAKLGWSPALWQVLMFGSAIFAFGSLKWMRLIGLMALLWLSYIWVNPQGEKILMLSPFHLRSQWWGILGLIGWDYLVGATVFLLFKGNRTALLGSMVLLLGLFAADHAGAFDGCWLTKVVGIGDTLGAQGAITVGGVLLASILKAPELGGTVARVRFALLFIGATRQVPCCCTLPTGSTRMLPRQATLSGAAL
jgi:heparan-alpha-glucosaminide N-acetyltransferase